MRPIDADALYERLKADEELARNRVIDTPSSFPNGAVNPSAIRYMAQLNERTRFKEMMFDAPTIEPMRWIPCSERLPEEHEVVLTQAQFKDDVKMAVSSRVDFNYWTGWGTRDINVVAWMPLPEPWKGDADDTVQ